jgi:hypothetical protein
MNNTTSVIAIVLTFVAVSAKAKPPTIPLVCGKAYGATVQRQYLDKASGGGDIYNVQVTFTGSKPARAKVEFVLRECIATAVAKDASKDVLATAWLKKYKGGRDTDDEQISPFSGLKYISYTAATKKVEVHELVLKLKKK